MVSGTSCIFVIFFQSIWTSKRKEDKIIINRGFHAFILLRLQYIITKRHLQLMINDIGNNIKRSKQVKVCSSVLYSTHVNLPRGKPGLFAPMKVRYKFNIAFLKGSLIKGAFTKAFTATFF